MNAGSSLHEGNSNQDRQEVYLFCIYNEDDDIKNKEPPSGAGSQWEGDMVEYVWHDILGPANRPLPPTVEKLMEIIFAGVLLC